MPCPKRKTQIYSLILVFFCAEGLLLRAGGVICVFFWGARGAAERNWFCVAVKKATLAATPASNRAAHSQYHSCRVFKRAFARRVGLILAMGIYNVIRSGANTMLSDSLNFIFLKGGVEEFHFGSRKLCAGKCPRPLRENGVFFFLCLWTFYWFNYWKFAWDLIFFITAWGRDGAPWICEEANHPTEAVKFQVLLCTDCG
ncbi:hypothetical protein TcCL_ESM07428 [Trypanosoma cruzi]|nr:hypothetical protein TcCL_ESM07428 [Trypanosoma cruzi]